MPGPCGALEQTWGPKTKEIRLDELVILVYAKRVRQSGTGLFWAIRWPFWPHFLRYDLQTCFASYLDKYCRQTDL